MEHCANADTLALVRRFVAQHHPDAKAALLAGSRSRGGGVPGSDYDVILLFSEVPNGAWRETTAFEQQVVEAFAHDRGTLAYFCREVDRPSGLPVLPTMIAEGFPVLSRSPTLLEDARRIAAETLQSGPPPLAPETVRERRYAVTELAATLGDNRAKGIMIAVGAALHIALADFALRAAGRWSARGKAIPDALAAMNPALAVHFTTAFAALFVAKDAAPVLTLADSILAPYGGPLRTGFRQAAPADWRV
jgi:hypothetical protein